MRKSRVYLETSFMFYLTGRETNVLSWNCKHLANPHTFPKTKEVIESFGLHCPQIITPRSYLEDFCDERQ